MAKKKIVLIDGHALVHRAFHALPSSFTSPDGIPTNAIFGFSALLIKMIKDLEPDYIAAAFDLAGPTFRHEEFEEYKSHRVKAPDELYIQVPHIKEILNDFGIPIYEKPGFEADDVIGTLATKFKDEPDLQVVIMTGDLDTLQLVEDDKVIVFTPRKGVSETAIYNEKEVKKRYNIDPEQLVDFKGLKGDPSDNIPGVPGIGDKTASELIKKFGSLEELYRAIEADSPKIKKITPRILEKLKEFKDQAFFSKRLATIITNVDMEFSLGRAEWRKHMDRGKLEKELEKLALFSVLRRLAELDSPAKKEEPKQAAIPEMEIESVSTSSKDVATILKAEEIIVYPDNGNLLISDSEAKQIAQVKAKDFKPGKAKIVTHDSKELHKQLYQSGANGVDVIFDTKLAAYITNSDIRDLSVERLYKLEYGKELKPGKINIMQAIGELKRAYQEKLKTGEMQKVFDQIEKPLSPILALMELSGIKIDPKAIKKQSEVLNKEIAGLEKEIYDLAGIQFNINSPQQLSEVLFERIGIKTKVRKTGKGALSTRASELEKMLGEHPIIEKIMQYREYQKLRTTYIEPFPHLIATDGRLHTTFNQTGTTTGRLSSENPNLQNIPIRTKLGQEFRKAFVADKEKQLVSFDYSQLELRIVAHISNDEKMSEIFKRGEDIHTRTAAEIFEVASDKVTANMRRLAKVLNFGIIYGMGPMAFQRTAKVTREEARDFINRYMTEFSGVARYMQEMKQKAHKEGFVETIFGRRRYFEGIHSGEQQLIAAAERMAINHPVQGGSADLIKLAMIEIQKLINDKYDGKVKMLLQVHDELVFEMDQDIVSKASK